MAYLSTRRSSLLSSGSGPAQTSTTAAPATAGAAAPAQAPTSGAFQDLSGYLGASGDAAKSYADKILGGLDTSAGGAAAKVDTSNVLPSQVGATNQAIDTRNANAQAMKGTIDAYGQTGGLSQLLADKATTGSTPYTPGMASFDSYLLGKSGAQDQLAALRAKWDPLLADQGAATANAGTLPSPVLKPTAQPSPAPAPAQKPATNPDTGSYSGPGYNDPSKTPDGSAPGNGWTWSQDLGRWVKVGNGR